MKEVLVAEGLTFDYLGGSRGLKPISLHLSSGEALQISSPSGGGKSTLARCLTGLIPHLYHGRLNGRVWVDHQPVEQTPLWKLSETIGLVFQNPASQMLAPTVEEEIIFGLENLGLEREEIDRRVTQIMECFGLQALQGQSPQNISGGEQQKLALAAMIARQPKALVLDEPLSMLDTTAACDLVRVLSKLAAEGTGLVICEHRHEHLRTIPNLREITLNRQTTPISPLMIREWPGRQLADLLVEARGLKVERGGKLIIDDWDLSLKGGQLTAVVGRNGVGKTTLFRTLAGLQTHMAGEMGAWVNSHSEPIHLGMVFQNPDLQLFNATVRQEILYGIPNPDLILYHWLVNALDLQNYQGTSPLLLSEGEKRRVALATVLMHQPSHGILLDEPALGQDIVHKAQLVAVLRALSTAGLVVAYSTHDVELAIQAERLILLGPQGIIASAHPDELICQEFAWQRAGLCLPDWFKKPC